MGAPRAGRAPRAPAGPRTAPRPRAAARSRRRGWARTRGAGAAGAGRCGGGWRLGGASDGSFLQAGPSSISRGSDGTAAAGVAGGGSRVARLVAPANGRLGGEEVSPAGWVSASGEVPLRHRVLGFPRMTWKTEHSAPGWRADARSPTPTGNA